MVKSAPVAVEPYAPTRSHRPVVIGVLLAFFTIGAIMAAPDDGSWLLLVAWGCLTALAIELTWSVTKRIGRFEREMALLLIYLAVAFIFKALLMSLPDDLSFSAIFGDYRKYGGDVIADALWTLAPILPGVLAGSVLAQLSFRRNTVAESTAADTAEPEVTPPVLPTTWLPPLVFVIAGSIALKIFTHFYLGWGLPGLIPANSIPFVTGALTMYVRLGVFTLSIIYLFKAFAVDGIAHRIVALAFAGSLVVIDIFVGSKFSMVYLLIAMYFIYQEYRATGRTVARGLVFVFAAAIATMLLIYDYVNYIRFARLHDVESFYQSLLFAIDAVTLHQAELSTPLASLFERVSGFENFIKALEYRSVLQPDLDSLFISGDIAKRYTELATGIEGSINAVGSTQAGFIALIAQGNPAYAFLVALGYGFVTLRTIIFARERLLRHADSRIAFSIITSIFLVYVQLGSGNLLFYGKELAVILITLVFYERFLSYPIPTRAEQLASAPYVDTAGLPSTGRAGTEPDRALLP